MSCFLTPDLKPFLGGTYFPPQDAYGRPGFKTVLKRIAEVWKQKKDEIKQQSSDSMQQLVDMTVTQGGLPLTPDLLPSIVSTKDIGGRPCISISHGT